MVLLLDEVLGQSFMAPDSTNSQHKASPNLEQDGDFCFCSMDLDGKHFLLSLWECLSLPSPFLSQLCSLECLRAEERAEVLELAEAALQGVLLPSSGQHVGVKGFPVRVQTCPHGLLHEEPSEPKLP